MDSLDVDDFKRFNDDRFGHPAGDGLLRELGALLVSQTREQVDLVARYGGEEFSVILPSAGTDGAAALAGRLRETWQADALAGRLAEPNSPGGDGEAARSLAERIRRRVEHESFGFSEAPPVVTVSVGVASLGEHATTVDGLVEAADRALYRAKAAGKNRVEVAGS